MQRANMPKTDTPEDFGKIIEGPKPKFESRLAAERLTAPIDDPRALPRSPAMDRGFEQRMESRIDDRRFDDRRTDRRASPRRGRAARRQNANGAVEGLARISVGTWVMGLAGLWLLVGVASIINMQLDGRLAGQGFWDWMLLVIGMMVPIGVMGLVIMVLRHTDNLRSSALSMGRLAARLTEPDTSAVHDVSTLGESIRGELDRVTASLDHAVRRVGVLEEMLKAQTRMMDETAQTVDKHAKAFGDTLDGQRVRMANVAKQLTEEVKGIEVAVENQATRITEATARAGEQLKSAQAGLDERSRSLETIAANVVRNTHEATTQLAVESKKLVEITDKASGQTEELVAKYSKQTELLDRVVEKLASQNGELDSVLETQRAALVRIGEMIDGQAAQIAGQVGAGVSDLTAVIEGVDLKAANFTQDVVKRVERISRAGDIAAETIAKAGESARRAAEDVRSGLFTQSDQATALLEAHLEQARGALGQLGKEVAATVKGQTETAVSGLGDQLDRIRDGLEAQVAEAANTLGNLQGELLNTAETNVDTIRHQAEYTRGLLESLNSELSSSVTDAKGTMAAQVKAAREALSDLKVDLDKAMETGGDALKHQTDSARKTVEKLREDLHKAAVEAGTVLLDKSAKARLEIEGATQKADAAVKRLSTETNQSLGALSKAVNALSEQLDGLPDHADASAQRIRSVIDGQIEEINKIAATAMEKAQALHTVVEQKSDDAPQAKAPEAKTSEPAAANDAAPGKGKGKEERATQKAAAEPAQPAEAPAPEASTTNDASADRDPYPQIWPGMIRGPRRPVQVDMANSSDWSQRLVSSMRALDGGQDNPAQNTGSQEASTPPARPEPEQPKARPREAAPRRRDNEEAGGRGKSGLGWREILKKAERSERESAASSQPRDTSGDDAARASLRVIETLQAMAIDLDRALEEDPPSELLQRYLNGERNVFAKRLVSMGGPEMADKIRRKYGQDHEFRHEVNRYINEFETMLDTISGNDRENILAETYLTSQTGKVYMLLVSAVNKR